VHFRKEEDIYLRYLDARPAQEVQELLEHMGAQSHAHSGG
jgi:hypothetical protein